MQAIEVEPFEITEWFNSLEMTCPQLIIISNTAVSFSNLLKLFAKGYIISENDELTAKPSKGGDAKLQGPSNVRWPPAAPPGIRPTRVGLFLHFDIRCKIMDCILIAEAADKWGITRRRVQVLCAQKRIPNLTKFGKAWAIPKNAKKPEDARKA